MTDRQALFVGDILATGYWAADISEIGGGDNVLVLGGGPTGVCCALCADIMGANVVLCEKNRGRGEFLRKNFPSLKVVSPEEAGKICAAFPHGGADRVIEAAGGEDTFQTAWKLARPNAIVTVVAMYDKPHLSLIAQGRLDTAPLITHTFSFDELDKAYKLFSSRADGVMKVAVEY